MSYQHSKESTTVLVIDTYEDAYDLVKQFLDMKGNFKLGDLVSHGKDGVEKAKELNPDIVFIDRNLPDMNSIELIRQIKQLFPEVFIIIMSRTNELEWIIASREAGANEILTKPFPIDHLDAIFRARHN